MSARNLPWRCLRLVPGPIVIPPSPRRSDSGVNWPNAAPSEMQRWTMKEGLSQGKIHDPNEPLEAEEL